MFYMVNFSTIILSSEVSGPGGLFDINGTLPLVAAQFVFLMIVLNIILFNPLLTIMEEREDYILTNLGKAAALITEANQLTKQYEDELANIRKQAQLEITDSQKIHKEILDLEIDISQKSIDKLLNIIVTDFEEKRTSALSNLDDSIQSLCDDVNKKLLI